MEARIDRADHEQSAIVSKSAWQTPQLRKAAIKEQTQEGTAQFEDGTGLSSQVVER